MSSSPPHQPPIGVEKAMALFSEQRSAETKLERSPTQAPASSPSMRPIFYEDPTFHSVAHPYDRARCRAWRYKMELEFGRYNAELNHKCTRRGCLQPGNLNNREHDETRTEYVHAIDGRRHLYGCPRSGVIHQCGFDKTARVLTCHYNPQAPNGNYLPCETESGAIICLFSGMQVQPDALVYEPRNDRQKHADTTPMVHGVIATRNRSVRAVNARMDSTVKRAVARVTKEALTKTRTAKESAALIEETTREMRRMKLRARSPKRSFRTMEDSDSSDSNSPSSESAPTSPKRQRIVITGSINAAKWIPLAGDYRIPEADWTRIQNNIDYILFDPVVRRDAENFQHSIVRNAAGTFPRPLGNICGLPIDQKPSLHTLQLRHYYTARCALVYALAKELELKQQPVAAPSKRRQRTRASRKRRKGTNHRRSIDLKHSHVTYVLLQVLARGIQHGDVLANLASGRDPDDTAVVTNIDIRLENALPSKEQIYFYGLQKKVRRDMFANSFPIDVQRAMTAYHDDPQLYRTIQSNLAACEHPPDYLRELFIETTERFTHTRKTVDFDMTAQTLDQMEGDIEPVDGNNGHPISPDPFS